MGQLSGSLVFLYSSLYLHRHYNVEVNMHAMTYDNEIDNKDNVQIKAESSFIDPAVKSLVGLKDWILTMLGYPLVTVELNDN